MIRIGQGYDVHRLVPERKLIIGGAHIPYSFGLWGHSDADVLAHAIMDAMLGACALGDIGQHFPDDDPAYEGADSMELLKKVTQIIGEKGYKIGNIDSTVIAERPHMSNYIGSMRRNIAEACGVDISAVSVKATTEEKLGFTGACEGIAAHAVCVLEARDPEAGGKKSQ